MVYFFFCVCAWKHMCLIYLCISAGMYSHAYTCRGQTVPVAYSITAILHIIPLIQDHWASSWGQEAGTQSHWWFVFPLRQFYNISLARLSSQKSACLCFPSSGIKVVHHHAGLYTWLLIGRWEFKLRSSHTCAASALMHALSHLPSLMIHFNFHTHAHAHTHAHTQL